MSEIKIRALSEIRGEDAFDVVAEIFESLSEIFDDAEFKRLVEEKKSKISLATYLLKTHKRAILHIFATLAGVDDAEYARERSLVSIFKDAVMVMDDKELRPFLEQWRGQGSSGSPTVTTEGDATESFLSPAT